MIARKTVIWALVMLAVGIAVAFWLSGTGGLIIGGLIGLAGLAPLQPQSKTPEEVAHDEKNRIADTDPATVVHDLGGGAAEVQRETDVDRIIRDHRRRSQSDAGGGVEPGIQGGGPKPQP